MNLQKNQKEYDNLLNYKKTVFQNRGGGVKYTFGWMDGVRRALNDRGMDVREASECARNRNDWRTIVTQF